MTRLLASISSTALLAAAALAQCPQGATANLVKWSASSGYAATQTLDDESITSPPIALTAFPNFPMAGAVGNLDQMWVNSNGEIYLTDSTLALLQPVGGSTFGTNSLVEMRGNIAGGSARIVPLGGDHQGSIATGANWDISVDQSGGVVTVTWVDLRRFGNTTGDRFSVRATLFPTGAVQYDYGTGFPLTGFTGRYVGISIGNLVGTTSSPSQDLSVAGTSSGLDGMIYQNFTGTAPNDWDLSGQSLTIVPNGTGGYVTAPLVPYVPPQCASNLAYGAGCYSYVGPDTANLMQLFADVPAAKAALDGNSLSFTKTATGYVANWLPGTAGALYLAPSGTATIVANADDTTSNLVPSAAIPIPGGSAGTWTISSNGVLTAAATGNQGTGFTATLAATATATGLAWYVWSDHNPAETGSGKVKWEEVSGVLYVTFDGVEFRGGTPTLAPSTFQFQIDMTTGDLTMVFPSFSISNATNDVLVGCTLAGAGPTPVSQTLSATTNVALVPPATLSPMTLSAAPRPVINPSTNVTFTANNVYEFQPSSGLYLSTLFFSVNPIPGGFDLFGILTGTPGCNAYIGTLDLDLGAQLTFAPTATWSFNFDNITFAPGNVIAAQAVCLYNGAFPLANGESGGFILSNGVLSTTQPQ